MNRRIKELVLLFIVLVFFAIYIKTWVIHSNLDNKILLFIISLSFTGVVALLYVMLDLQNCTNEGYGETQNYFAPSQNCAPVADDTDLPVSDLARMKGGWYMHQGDSEIARKYQELIQTQEGRDLLSTQNCTKGYIGEPLGKFTYVGQTNEKWQNPQCQ